MSGDRLEEIRQQVIAWISEPDNDPPGGLFYTIPASPDDVFFLLSRLEVAEERARQADENAAVLADQRDALLHAMRAEEPPNEVFLALQRLHGLPEIGSPSARLEVAEADARQAAEELRIAQEMIEEHTWTASSVHRAASVLTAVKRARAALGRA